MAKKEKVKTNREYLAQKGLTDTKLQKIAIEKLPEQFESVQSAHENRTTLTQDKFTAIEVISYQGLLMGLVLAQRVQTQPQGDRNG